MRSTMSAVLLPAVFVLTGATPPLASGPEPIAVPLKPTIAADRQACNQTRASGLGVRQLKAGEGAMPEATDFVAVRYIGYLRSNGAVFDQNEMGVFPLDGVVPGFSEGILQMNRGAVYRLCIPAKLGYADKDMGDIPPNSDIGFQVELLDFKTAAEVKAMRSADEAGAGEPEAAAKP
jgi:FKBP-type peptidyl-prolyl cis-trans isomerase FkpA